MLDVEVNHRLSHSKQATYGIAISYSIDLAREPAKCILKIEQLVVSYMNLLTNDTSFCKKQR